MLFDENPDKLIGCLWTGSYESCVLYFSSFLIKLVYRQYGKLYKSLWRKDKEETEIKEGEMIWRGD